MYIDNLTLLLKYLKITQKNTDDLIFGVIVQMIFLILTTDKNIVSKSRSLFFYGA